MPQFLENLSMKKDIPSDAHDARHKEGPGRNQPTLGKGKTNNSQDMTDMMKEFEEQKAGRNTNKEKENDNRQDESGDQHQEMNY